MTAHDAEENRMQKKSMVKKV